MTGKATPTVELVGFVANEPVTDGDRLWVAWLEADHALVMDAGSGHVIELSGVQFSGLKVGLHVVRIELQVGFKLACCVVVVVTIHDRHG